jgi:hypothetical protein
MVITYAFKMLINALYILYIWKHRTKLKRQTVGEERHELFGQKLQNKNKLNVNKATGKDI